jgi:hypothetical protein
MVEMEGTGSLSFTYRKVLILRDIPIIVLWDNNTRVIFTLAAAVVGLIAYLIIPGRKQIEEQRSEGYSRTGKWMVFIFAFLILGIAGVLAWELFQYKVQNLWVAGNLAIFASLGIILLAGNIWTMRYLKNSSEHVDIVDVEAIELSAEEGAAPGLLGGTASPEPIISPAPPRVEPSPVKDDVPKE